MSFYFGRFFFRLNLKEEFYLFYLIPDRELNSNSSFNKLESKKLTLKKPRQG